MSLWPKEHGAYGQVAFPLVAAFGVAGVSTGGLLIAGAVLAAFVAHEPALVVLGYRGPRAKRELWPRAARWLKLSLALCAAAGIGALLAMQPSVRWSVIVPLIPAVVLAIVAIRGREKSWYGEVAAALAFAGVAVPVVTAGGLPTATAAAVAIPLALLFVSTTLAVRVVILRVRGGGNPKAVAITRRAALSIAIGGLLLLALLVAKSLIPASVIAASAPGLLTAAGVALWPPPPARLRTLGWTLVAVSVLTTAIVISLL